MSTHLKQLVEQLNKELEISPPVAADAAGLYDFPMEGIKVTLRPLDPGVAFDAILADAPTESEEAFLQQLLVGNLFGQGTRGAILGLSPDGKSLTLSLEIDYNIEYKDFKDALEDFLNVADFWRSEALKTDRNADA